MRQKGDQYCNVYCAENFFGGKKWGFSDEMVGSKRFAQLKAPRDPGLNKLDPVLNPPRDPGLNKLDPVCKQQAVRAPGLWIIEMKTEGKARDWFRNTSSKGVLAI